VSLIEDEIADEQLPANDENLTPSKDHPGLFVNGQGEIVDDLGTIIRLSENKNICIKCHYSKHEKIVVAWDKSKHSRKKVLCVKCHGGNPDGTTLKEAKDEKTTNFKHIKESMLKASGDVVKELAFDYCGQCHGDKYRDWEAGIHGKRTGFWNGEKEYWVCIRCHDPHNPKFKKRVPKPRPLRPEELVSIKPRAVAAKNNKPGK
jgi:uncharacterized CHY-type Zn-finger protein